jgi:hypothetical protein
MYINTNVKNSDSFTKSPQPVRLTACHAAANAVKSG